jgi:hypothetical protein
LNDLTFIALPSSSSIMIGATRRWFRRNRKGLAIGAGVIGAGYLAGQYVLSKITEARERMSSDRIAREKYVAFLSSFRSFGEMRWSKNPSARVLGFGD